LTLFADDKNNEKKLKLLGGLMGAASTFSSIMGNIMKAFPKNVKVDKDKFETNINHLDTMSKIVGKIKQPMKDLVAIMVGGAGADDKGILGTIPTTRGTKTKLANLKSVLEAATSITSIITSMGSKPPAEFQQKMTNTASNLGYAYALFDQAALNLVGSLGDGISTRITIPDFINKINKIKIPTINKQKLTGIKSLDAFMDAYSSAVPTIAGAAKTSQSDVVSGIVQVVKQINEMNTALSTLPTISIDVAMAKFTKAAVMGSGGYDLKIKPANVSINVNVDVNLNKANFVKWLAGSKQTSGKSTSLQVHKT
jgi:hypothetical protein